MKVWKLWKNRATAGKDARQQPLTWKNGKGSPENTNKKKRWSHKCVVSNTQPLTTSWQTPVCVYMCFPPKIFTSRENTIESQQKPQGSSIRFIRLRVKPGYMQGAKKDFNAQNVIISVGELAGESILCSASTVGSFTKLQSTSKTKRSHGLLTLHQHQTTGSDVISCLYSSKDLLSWFNRLLREVLKWRTYSISHNAAVSCFEEDVATSPLSQLCTCRFKSR